VDTAAVTAVTADEVQRRALQQAARQAPRV